MSWVPIPVAPAGHRQMPARWVALIVVGSIATLLLAGTGLAVLTSLYSAAGSRAVAPGARSSCLPSDFPNYPGAAVVTSFGAFNVCTTAFTTQDTSDQVLFFYQRQLDSFPWRVTGGSVDQGRIAFSRQDGRRGSGELSVAQGTNPTQFSVVYQA